MEWVRGYNANFLSNGDVISFDYNNNNNNNKKTLIAKNLWTEDLDNAEKLSRMVELYMISFH